jgi:hypothetical protein
MLMTKVLSTENMLLAHKKVVSNKGAPGIDGVTVDELWAFCRENWDEIRKKIANYTYLVTGRKLSELPLTAVK